MISDNLSDPAGANALVAAVQWLQVTLLGTLATTVAVIAIAWIGFEMLTGRMDLRSGAAKVIGCFILFGASSIVAGLRAAATTGNGAEAMFVPAPAAMPPALPTAPQAYDPYAGASVRQP